MNTVKLNDKYFDLFISKKKIKKAVKKLAKQIENDLDKDEVPIFMGVLNGSFMFVADFVREYSFDCHLSFVKLTSYQGTNSTGKVKKLVGINEDLKGKTVVILEDIIDTGNTLEEIYNIFKNENLKQLKIATLFFKPDVYKKDLQIDYKGISIEDKFIVGYGLDYDGLGRNLPDVYQLKNV
ncbi:MAG: hypoxanthine phosphoribosyltransferase [Bacteroidota bacterium]